MSKIPMQPMFKWLDFRNKAKITGLQDGVSPSDAVNVNQLTILRHEMDEKFLDLGEYVSVWDVNTGIPTTGSGVESAIAKGDWWRCSVVGTFNGIPVNVGDRLFAAVAGATVAGEFDLLKVYSKDNIRTKFENVIISPLGTRIVHDLRETDVDITAKMDVDGIMREIEVEVAEFILGDGSVDVNSVVLYSTEEIIANVKVRI